MILVDVSGGQVVWKRSIDADVTGKRATLEVAGSPMGYFAMPVSIANLDAIAVGLDGSVVLLDAEDGSTRAVMPVSGSAIVTCGVPGTNALLVATDSEG